ncbi:unnamed protein product [Xylocopa violacea]|uniref:Uncharacterized protein n=1 Tax=Xylocopa violacea TaxID=135666 RepID=A0ABP1PDH7_XYLVO
MYSQRTVDAFTRATEDSQDCWRPSKDNEREPAGNGSDAEEPRRADKIWPNVSHRTSDLSYQRIALTMPACVFETLAEQLETVKRTARQEAKT